MPLLRFLCLVSISKNDKKEERRAKTAFFFVAHLKKLGFDKKHKKYVLHSCNPDMESYPDIIVDELQIQGVVKGSYHRH